MFCGHGHTIIYEYSSDKWAAHVGTQEVFTFHQLHSHVAPSQGPLQGHPTQGIPRMLPGCPCLSNVQNVQHSTAPSMS